MRDQHFIALLSAWALFVFLPMTPFHAHAGVPVVADVRVTDVTARSFSVVWAASEPSRSSLNVFKDQAGLTPAANIAVTSQPVESGSPMIAIFAENTGVMKARVTGLAPNTTYYFQTVTTSKATGHKAFSPQAAPLPSVTTEDREVRSEMSGQSEVPMINDLIVTDCYLPDGVTPAEGTLLFASVPGADYPVSRFVGDGIPAPAAIVDLNNFFGQQSHQNMTLAGGEALTLTRFMGMQGLVSEQRAVPPNNRLAEIKPPDPRSSCEGDRDGDGDVDGKDLATAASEIAEGSFQGNLNTVVMQFGRVECY